MERTLSTALVRIAAAAALLIAGAAHAQVQKCTGADGKITYSDKLCPADAKQADVKISRDQNLMAGQSYGQYPAATRIVFTGPPAVDYIKAGALLDNISIQGRDCEWALKVDKRKMADCVAFIGKLQPGGEFVQITDHISELNKTKKNVEDNLSEVNMMMRHMQDIIRYKEYAAAKLNNK